MVLSAKKTLNSRRNRILIGCLLGIGLLIGGYLILGSLLGGKTNQAYADSVTQSDELDDGNIIELKLVPPDKFVRRSGESAARNSLNEKPASPKAFGGSEKPNSARTQTVGVIDKAVICLAIEQQEADNVIQAIPSSARKIYCWVRILNGGRQKIRYIWYLNQTAYPSQWLYVTNDRFRSWCPKYIPPQTKGSVKVEIVDQTGRLLKSLELPISAVKDKDFSQSRPVRKW